MKLGFVVALIVAVIVGLTALARPAREALAHPLGNFTTNHYDRITVSAEGIEVFSVLDLAEIPTFQARQDMDTNDDGGVGATEAEAYAAETSKELLSKLRLTVSGDDEELSEVEHSIAFPEGQGGLKTLRLTVTSKAALPDGWRDSPPQVAFANEHQQGADGWREIVVIAGPGVEIEGDAPRQDVSRALTSYPEGVSPVDVRAVTFGARPGATTAAPALAEPTPDPKHERATRGNPDGALERFADLIAKDRLTPGVIAIALIAALGFGALHALTPGHGKTIVAAYLVGSRGTLRHALLLGLTVTATHTSSVYAMGFVTLYLSDYIVPADLYPWLGLVSGVIILVMGASLFVGRLQASGLAGAAWRWLRQRAASTRERAAHAGLALATADAGTLVLGGAHARPPAVAHDHGHDGNERTRGEADGHEREHDDASVHSHGFGPAHTHVVPGSDSEPVTWQRLLGLGLFGGMIPCPSAIVVMLSAIALHRVGFGLVLILAFSLGLAAVLSGIGFALVFATRYADRVPLLRALSERAVSGRSGWFVRLVPVLTAIAVVGAGTFVTLRAIGQF